MITKDAPPVASGGRKASEASDHPQYTPDPAEMQAARDAYLHAARRQFLAAVFCLGAALRCTRRGGGR